MTTDSPYDIVVSSKGRMKRDRLKVILEMAANSCERRRVRWEGNLSQESHMENNRIEK